MRLASFLAGANMGIHISLDEAATRLGMSKPGIVQVLVGYGYLQTYSSLLGQTISPTDAALEEGILISARLSIGGTVQHLVTPKGYEFLSNL